MPAVSGVNFVLEVSDGVGGWNQLAGQRSTTLNRTGEAADATSKDQSAWYVSVPTVRNWGMDAECVAIEGDTALDDLEDAYMSGVEIDVRITTPASTVYSGNATVTDMTMEGPHDDVLSISVSLQGNGELTKT